MALSGSSQDFTIQQLIPAIAIVAKVIAVTFSEASIIAISFVDKLTVAALE